MSGSPARRTDHATDRVDETGAILWEADPVTFQFTYVSPAAEQLFGYPLQEWLTRANFWVDLLHPADRDRAVEECKHAVAHGGDHELEYRVKTADGRVLWIRDLVRVAVDDRGQATALHGAMVDVTPSRLLLDQIRQSRSVEALGRLTQAISPAHAGAVDVNDELRKMERTVRQLIGVTIELELTLGASRATVRVAPGVIEQVVLTIAANARDAMPAGGTLRIVTFDIPHVQRQGIPSTSPQLVIEIEDTGSGMPPDVRAHLFEPYFTTKGDKGAGLGLVTINRLVFEAGGHIEWNSHVGHGTRFRVFLPLVTS